MHQLRLFKFNIIQLTLIIHYNTMERKKKFVNKNNNVVHKIVILLYHHFTHIYT